MTEPKVVLTVSERPLDGKFRILDSTGQVATRSDNGNPMDHGGHDDRDTLVRMAGHIMDSMNRKKRE